ncbi:metal-dependent hydrolase [Salipiger marinus]|uniref:metal-dependent hydrolase n=1 Tax=Salipiger marinus TaxID=555512 RepID=UPI001E425FD8|nr:metal-dependent hydrolase [Salipiger manganoxidans]MCD1617710.1 metal-dependent hydrolase [Salipiger manganoxidans]MEB3418242.1 metal-dependent hydrolase [Salipiger manganoxidans]
MNILWLGHGSFRIDIEDQVLLIDPWVHGNPMMPEDRIEEALQGATQILVTHGHSDHTADLVTVSQKTGAPVSGMVELAGMLHGQGAVEGHAFNKGGTVSFGNVRVTMVPASHSSSLTVDGKPHYAGMETGFMIAGEGHVIYFSGDTTLMADMGWMGAYHKPDIGILSCGGYYTMDMAAAAYAAKTWFDFKTVIPGHYRTFPALEQSAAALAEALPGVRVVEPQVLDPITI